MDATDFIEFINNSLWAEDGVVFINEANNYGINSIWRPYAGYLHLYPRLFALIASHFDLIFTPWIFMGGFVLAVWVMMLMIMQGMRELNIHPIGILAVAVLIGLQPNHGQIFFTLTNSQWFFGVALCVLVSVTRLHTSSNFYILGGAVFSLTGPFSVLLFPVLLTRFYLDRDRVRSLIFVLVMVICVGIQMFFIVASGRGDGEISDNWRGWMVVFFDSMTFGRQSGLVVGLSLVMWIFVLSSLFGSWRCFFGEYRDHVTTAMLLLAAGGLMYAGSLWGFKDSPWGLNPITGNARYFFSPYAMIALSMLALYRLTPRSAVSVLFLFALISFIEFRSISRPDLQFPSFAAFSKARDGIVIPIAPTIADYPGWHIASDSKPPESMFQSIHSFVGLDKNSFLEVGGATLKLNLLEICPISEHIGLSVNTWMSGANYVQASLDGDVVLLKRFYPAGEVELQFAFARADLFSPVVLDTGSPIDHPTRTRIDVYCLAKKVRAGFDAITSGYAFVSEEFANDSDKQI